MTDAEAPSLASEVLNLRAGQAASAKRIKALEYDLMWTDQAWEAAQEAVVYGYTLLDDMDAKIDAARLEGIRLGLEAAARLAEEESGNLSTTARVLQGFHSPSSATVLFTDKGVGSAIRALNPETIAKEAQHD